MAGPHKPSDPCSQGDVNSTRIKALESSDSKQWEAIDKLRNRVPTWATLAMTVMGSIIGFLANQLMSK